MLTMKGTYAVVFMENSCDIYKDFGPGKIF